MKNTTLANVILSNPMKFPGSPDTEYPADTVIGVPVLFDKVTAPSPTPEATALQDFNLRPGGIGNV